MTILTYSLTALLLFGAIFLGSLLGYISNEELKTGKQYFKILKSVIFFTMLGLLLYFFNNLIIPVIVLAALFFVFKKKKYHDIIVYLMLAVILFFNNELNIIIPTLIFVYGLLQGTLVIEKVIHKKNKILLITKTIFTRYIWFFILSLILLIL
ncbi:MAG: hypothetical protein U9R08_00605 [Nanoarchaeota archaeon]|nr:hypothetical protein [Nanoarchaeota archaeon]